MTREQRSSAVVRRFIDGAINGRDLAVIDETWADEMTWHGGSMGTYESKAAFLEFAKANAGGAWEEMHLEIHDTIASGDHAAIVIVAAWSKSSAALVELADTGARRG